MLTNVLASVYGYHEEVSQRKSVMRQILPLVVKWTELSVCSVFWFSTPAFERGHCYEPYLQNGNFTTSDPLYGVGAVVQFTCDPGHSLEQGPPVIECISARDPYWNDTEPLCKGTSEGLYCCPKSLVPFFFCHTCSQLFQIRFSKLKNFMLKLVVSTVAVSTSWTWSVVASFMRFDHKHIWHAQCSLWDYLFTNHESLKGRNSSSRACEDFFANTFLLTSVHCATYELISL